MVLLAMTAVLLLGCGGGFHPNPWAGDYFGYYEMFNDHGTMDVHISTRGDITGEWRSRVDGAYGAIWGTITRQGDFTMCTDWVRCWGHGEIWDGVRVLVIDGYEGRKPDVKISNLKEKTSDESPDAKISPLTEGQGGGDTIADD
jgi:hypothetical protein